MSAWPALALTVGAVAIGFGVFGGGLRHVEQAVSAFDCDVTRTGVRVIGDADAQRLTIGGTTLDVQTAPLFVSAEFVDGAVRVAFPGGDDIARLVAKGDTVEVLGPTSGIRNVLVTDRAVYWVERGGKDYWTQTWTGQRTKRPIPIGLTSQGLAFEAANGRLWWADEFQRAPIVIHGVRFHDPFVDGSWTFGLTGRDNRVIASKAGGPVLDCRLAGNSGPRGRQMADGSAVVAANRYGRFSVSSAWTPYQPPKPPPPKPPKPKPDPQDDGDDMADPELIARLTRIETKIDRLLDALDELPEDDGPHDPPPSDPEVPEIDIAAVTWLNSGNPLDFRVTSEITDVTIEKKKDDGSTPYTGDNWTVCFPHTKAGVWPELTNDQGREVRGQRLRLRAYQQPLVRRRRGVVEGESNLQAPVESIGTRLVGHRPAHEERSAPVVGTDVWGMDRDHGLHARARWRGR